MTFNNIENIVFDLGGVVINLARDKAVEALTQLGVKDAESLLGVYAQKGPFYQLETGEITASDMFDILLPQCRPGTACNDIRDAFEKFLVDLPVERLRLIRKLRDLGYKTFVLSNTNPIMFHHWIDEAFRADGLSVNDYFDGVVVSFQEKTCKPDVKIFENLIRRYNLKPGNTLFLDDSEANCKAAESIGINAIRVYPDGSDSMEEICSRLIEAKENH